jgi:hypothetical protein
MCVFVICDCVGDSRPIMSIALLRSFDAHKQSEHIDTGQRLTECNLKLNALCQQADPYCVSCPAITWTRY